MDSPAPVLAGLPDREAITAAIVTTVAEERGVDPLDLRPLYATLDPDSLASLVTQGTNGRVVFSYEGCEVEVTMDDPVTVHASPRQPRFGGGGRRGRRP